MKQDNSIRPEDILPNGIDIAAINGKPIQKGTIAAFLANIDILENSNSTKKQKEDAMKELASTIIATGLYKLTSFKNAKVEQILSSTNLLQINSHES